MQLSLKRHAVASLDLRADDRLRLSTRNGTAWVTKEGVSLDFVLSASRPLSFTGPGRVVVEALEDDMFVHTESVPGPVRGPVLLAVG
jgi:hypothetical protein